jgi:dTDP-4-amino-4,6-dideoxygalactose transaminase
VSQTQQKIPILDLRPEIDEQWDELMEAIQGVLRSGQFILGPNVEAFEDEFAAYLGVKHAVGVNSGTDALVISLRGLGIGPGDEVITTPFTFFATPESISNVGATPVFVDIDPATFNIDPALIEPAITERTKAILPVHLYGLACAMEPIMEIAVRNGLKVVEDVAQAMGGTVDGKRLGTLGDAGAFSFFPSKNLGGFGDGGMIVTHDDALAEHARRLRAHGSRRSYANETLGYNSRLDELQAAVLRVKLRHLDRSNEKRRRAAADYGRALRGVNGVTIPVEEPRAHHVYHQYTVRILKSRRDELRKELAERGVDSKVYYPVPCHKLPVYGSNAGSLPVTEAAAREVLSLPIGPALTSADLHRVVKVLRSSRRIKRVSIGYSPRASR